MSNHKLTVTTRPAKLWTILLAASAMLAAALVAAGPARAETVSEAEVSALIERLTGGFATALQDEKAPQEARIDRLAGLFERNFDVERISNLILDPHVTRPSEAQMAEFRTLFGRYVAALCASTMSGFTEQALVITERRHHSDRQSFVAAQLRRPPPDQPVRIGFRISRTEQGLRIYDVLVEGISLVLTKRDEIRSLVRRDGIDKMLARLRTVTQLAENTAKAAAAR